MGQCMEADSEAGGFSNFLQHAAKATNKRSAGKPSCLKTQDTGEAYKKYRANVPCGKVRRIEGVTVIQEPAVGANCCSRCRPPVGDPPLLRRSGFAFCGTCQEAGQQCGDNADSWLCCNTATECENRRTVCQCSKVGQRCVNARDCCDPEDDGKEYMICNFADAGRPGKCKSIKGAMAAERTRRLLLGERDVLPWAGWTREDLNSENNDILTTGQLTLDLAIERYLAPDA